MSIVERGSLIHISYSFSADIYQVTFNSEICQQHGSADFLTGATVSLTHYTFNKFSVDVKYYKLSLKLPTGGGEEGFSSLPPPPPQSPLAPHSVTGGGSV